MALSNGISSSSSNFSPLETLFCNKNQLNLTLTVTVTVSGIVSVGVTVSVTINYNKLVNKTENQTETHIVAWLCSPIGHIS